jgi:hypothetical protein
MDLSYWVVIDMTSGTFFGADNCCLLNTRSLSAEQLAVLNEGADEERADLAEECGIELEAGFYLPGA